MLLGAREAETRDARGGGQPATQPLVPQCGGVDGGIEPRRDVSDHPPRDPQRQGALLLGQPPCCGRREIIRQLAQARRQRWRRSEEHTSELQSLMRISYAVFGLNKKNQ